MIYDFEPVQEFNGYDHPWPAGGGANKWDEVWELGSITNEGAPTPSTTAIRSKNHIPVSAETNYYIVTPAAMTVHYYEVDDTYISNESVSSSKEITTPADCAYMLFSMDNTYGTKYKHDIAINYPSTVTTYFPYENICPITGVDIPGIGTVYAGSIDTASRELSITRIKIIGGDSGWSKAPLGDIYFWYTSAPNGSQAAVPKGMMCDTYKVMAAQPMDDPSAFMYGSTSYNFSRLAIRDDRYLENTAAEFRQAVSKVVMIYPLATPVTVTLTEQQVTALLGELGVARNFNSAEIMVNVWLYMAQGRDPSDLTRQVLRPIGKPVIDKPISFGDDLVKELPADDVISPDEEPEENITEEKEEEDNASE